MIILECLHKKEEYMFVYIASTIVVDDEEYRVRVSIKKKVVSNIFFIINH